MKTITKSMTEIIDAKMKCKDDEVSDYPLDPSIIPNYMGINLCSVEGMTWTRQNDGQLVSLTINFIPNNEMSDTSNEIELEEVT